MKNFTFSKHARHKSRGKGAVIELQQVSSASRISKSGKGSSNNDVG
jgi:hypothetical protein